MELREAAERRNMLEIEIRDFVIEKCSRFEKETGLSLSNISIDMARLSEIGLTKEQTVIAGCTITVNL